MRSRLVVVAVAALLACQRRSGRPPEQPPEDESPAESLLAAPAADAGPAPGCRLSARHVVLAPPPGAADAGDALIAPIEAARAIALPTGRRVLWIDTRQGTLQLGADGRGAVTRRAMPAGERSDVLLLTTPRPAVTPAAAWVRDAPAARTHYIRTGDALDRGCRYTEQRDESLALSAVPTPDGLLLAWDEEGPGRWPGSIHVQSVPTTATGAAERDDMLPVCPSAMQVTPQEHDAHDPTLVALPDGSAVVFWLNARDLDPVESNDAATNVWARLLDGRGRPVGTSLRLMPLPGRRFGVSASEPVRVNAPDGNPTGVPVIFARAASAGGARVFWREREGASAVTLQRVVAAGRTGPLRALPMYRETSARGVLPTAMDPRGNYLVPPCLPG